MQKHRILLADDHELVLEGLRSLVEAEPDLRVVATATNGLQVLDAVREARPEAIVHQATALSEMGMARNVDKGFTLTNRLRTEGTHNLHDAAVGTGATLIMPAPLTVRARSVTWEKVLVGNDWR